LARRLHAGSSRASGPFVRVNCAAVPVEMWESEFFGHRRGAFTGASADREGRFQLADSGTLLLDEVGAAPLETQAKLLRVLQEGEFERLGEAKPTRVDVRLVASTNSELEADVKAGRFRSDLYYRIDVVRIEVPALRERPEDVPLLVRHFAAEIAGRMGREAPELGPKALARFQAYPWPGNVRELRSVLRVAAAARRLFRPVSQHDVHRSHGLQPRCGWAVEPDDLAWYRRFCFSRGAAGVRDDPVSPPSQ
jgi:transcriptional regulator with GAF, ATPase, and Fis domain